MLSDPSRTLVIAPNLKRRLSGVTTSIIQLIPVQNRLGQQIAVFGPGLPDHLPRLRYRDLPRLWRAPQGRPFRIWHARRNVEMLMGVVMRDILRMPLRLVFTSASQRVHSNWTRFLISRMDGVIATSHKTASYLKVPYRVSLHGINAERFRRRLTGPGCGARCRCPRTRSWPAASAASAARKAPTSSSTR